MPSPGGFLRNLIGFSVSSWIGFVIGIVSVPILTRLLDPSQFAAINLFNSAVNLMLGIVSLGMDSAYVRFFHEPPEGFTKNTLISKGLALSMVVLAVAASITIPFSGAVSKTLFGIDSQSVTLFFFLAIAAQVAIRYFTIYSRLLNKVLTYTVIAVSLQLASKFAVLLALPFHAGKPFLLAVNASGILALAAGLLLVHVRRGDLRWTDAKLLKSREYMAYSMGSWPVPVVIYANVYVSQMILRRYAGDTALGVFLSANIFASILAVIQGGFSNFWSGYMMANYGKEQERIRRVHDYVCLFVILSACGLVAIRDLVYMLIGPNYAGSLAIFPMVMMAPLCGMIVETTAYGMSIAKKAHQSLFAYALYFIVNNGLALALVPKLGMMGAGLAIMGSAMLNLLVQSILGQKHYRSLNNPWRTVFAGAALAAVALLNYEFRENSGAAIMAALAVTAVSVVVYLPAIKSLVGLARARAG